jgi:hypothetical protein
MAENEVPPLSDRERYELAAHAVQTAVKFEQATGSNCGSPKHLRTGLNLSKCDQAALVKLLIAKSILTLDEYQHALADEAEAEVERYQSAHPGLKFH